MSDPASTRTDVSRRTFLKRAAIAGSTLATISIPRSVHAGTDESLHIGLIGCGGRGSGAVVDALSVDPNSKLIAVSDTFRDRADQCLETLRREEKVGSRIVVDSDAVFDGFDGFKRVIDSGVDVVILATPPHFRPAHLRYAVEAGKHCFVEKPVAVDAQGVRHVMESCELAKQKNLSIVSGLCYRYDHGVRETIRKVVEDKVIGDIVAIQSNFNTTSQWHRGDKPEWSRMEYQIRNWPYYTWLSGDHIVEQAVHNLDKGAWLLGDTHPLQAMGIGGRQRRTGKMWGQIYDHFTVFLEYPEEKRVYFTCRQQDGTTPLCEDLVLGTKGQAEVILNRIYDEHGKRTWQYRGPNRSMFHNEQEEFLQSVRNGTPINNGHYMANSTMIGIMGRMAAYCGRTLKWDDCFNDNTRLGPSEYAWIDVPEPPVAIPG